MTKPEVLMFAPRDEPPELLKPLAPAMMGNGLGQENGAMAREFYGFMMIEAIARRVTRCCRVSRVLTKAATSKTTTSNPGPTPTWAPTTGSMPTATKTPIARCVNPTRPAPAST